MKGIYLMKKPIIKPEQGKRLKAALKYRNKSQKWLSDNAHISQPTISDIINGKVRLTEQNALLFSRVLDISLKYLLLESDYITSEEKAADRWQSYSKREQLYLQILELHGYELITTVSELEEKVSDSFFIKQWVIKDEWGKSTTLHHVNYDRARIIFLYDQKAKKLSPPILMSEFWEMISNIDYHFLCCLERPFRKYKDMIKYSIPLGKKPKI